MAFEVATAGLAIMLPVWSQSMPKDLPLPRTATMPTKVNELAPFSVTPAVMP